MFQNYYTRYGCFNPYQPSLFVPGPPLPVPPLISGPLPPIAVSRIPFNPQGPIPAVAVGESAVADSKLRADFQKNYLQNQKQQLTYLKEQVVAYAKSIDEALDSIDKEIAKTKKSGADK